MYLISLALRHTLKLQLTIWRHFQVYLELSHNWQHCVFFVLDSLISPNLDCFFDLFDRDLTITKRTSVNSILNLRPKPIVYALGMENMPASWKLSDLITFLVLFETYYTLVLLKLIHLLVKLLFLDKRNKRIDSVFLSN